MRGGEREREKERESSISSELKTHLFADCSVPSTDNILYAIEMNFIDLSLSNFSTHIRWLTQVIFFICFSSFNIVIEQPQFPVGPNVLLLVPPCFLLKKNTIGSTFD